ncbi:hypothetical protein [Streptomyces sp. NBC_00076]|uniref:hypothetical protein n=1 Tax=Streptomyces sp. NBC_00076 TaxID=2975642 RepID=UPI003252950D
MHSGADGRWFPVHDPRPGSGSGQDAREPTAALEVHHWAHDGADGVPSEQHTFRIPHRVCAAAVSEDGSAAAFLSGLLEGDRPPGSVKVYGVDPAEDPEARARLVGLVPGTAPPPETSVHDTLAQAGVTHGLDEETAYDRAGQLLDVLELRAVEHAATGTLPPGEGSRVALGEALVRLPRLLLLRDAFDGVDETSEAIISRTLKCFSASTGTVLFSTASPELADRLADHVVTVRDGEVVASHSV